MNKPIFCLLFIVYSLSFIAVKAQQPVPDTSKHAAPAPAPIVTSHPSDTAVHIYEGPGVSRSVQKRIEYARLSQGKFAGYRIQVSFGQDRNDANKLRNEFSGKFPELPTYLTYNQPYFKIYAGDFRTKLEAFKYLGQVKKAYPAAFVVRDKINPPPLTQ